MQQLFYYKIQQKFSTKCVSLFITKCGSIIENTSVITKCNKFITKPDSYLQNVPLQTL